MYGSAQPEETSGHAEDLPAGTDRPAVGKVSDRTNGNQTLAETELDSALQLLVERAQYITGATGTALALPQGDEMVCRASAGSSAPAVGARLQVRSGLSGESIARRQLLRCDNAEADPRVNLEACRALGIASIVVLPLLRRNGEVRGLFELFSDHPYAFEERDLIALERMADLTLTALDLAEQRQGSTGSPVAARAPEKAIEAAAPSVPPAAAKPALLPVTFPSPAPTGAAEAPAVDPMTAEPTYLADGSQVIASLSATVPVADAVPPPVPVSIPPAMLRVQKCGACGFPVSEGRTLCLDCERKETAKKDYEKKQRTLEQAIVEQKKSEQPQAEKIDGEQGSSPVLSSDKAGPDPADSAGANPEEFVPAFLANSAPASESWMANHVNLLAIVVLILSILVAVVVFR